MGSTGMLTVPSFPLRFKADLLLRQIRIGKMLSFSQATDAPIKSTLALRRASRWCQMIDVQIFADGEPPDAPADLEIKIDYLESGSAARVFEIAADLIRALEDVDSVLAKSIDSSIQTTLVVEDLQKSSIRIFLRNLLKAADDDALKALDWRPVVGQYLVRAKYAALRWLDQEASPDQPPQIGDLTDEIASLARETDVRHLPDYPAPNPARLVQSLDSLQSAKQRFRPGEALTITLDKTQYQVNLERTWSPTELVKDATELLPVFWTDFRLS